MSDLDVAFRAASVGAEIARAHRDGSLRRFTKGGADFATDVDIAVEQAILEVIRTARPDDAVRGEELDGSGPRDAERTWLVDPLCGTMNYAAGLSIYSVTVAVVRGDDVVAAVVAAPSGLTRACAGDARSPGVRFLLTDGSTAWSCREGSSELAEVKPSASSRLVEVNLETSDPDGRGFSSSRFLRSCAFQTLSPRFIGTGLPLAWVASGEYAGFVIPGKREPSVHFTAGIGLCRAAGCVLSGLHGEPLHLANEGIVAAADETTHELLLEGIAEQKL